MIGYVRRRFPSPLCWVLLLVSLCALDCKAQNKFSVDIGECGGDVHPEVTTQKTQIRGFQAAGIRMYGVLEFRHDEQDAKDKHCHVIYRLFVAGNHQKFTEVHHLSWDTEEGEIAGIDLIGFSPDGSKAAANFWLAEGDGVENRPVVYDLMSREIIYRSLEGKLSARVVRNCDQYFESLDGVTNDASIVISIPPMQECADGGLWLFSPRSDTLKQILKNSGRKRIE